MVEYILMAIENFGYSASDTFFTWTALQETLDYSPGNMFN